MGSSPGENIKPNTRFLLANFFPECICKCFSLYRAIALMLFPAPKVLLFLVVLITVVLLSLLVCAVCLPNTELLFAPLDQRQ